MEYTVHFATFPSIERTEVCGVQGYTVHFTTFPYNVYRMGQQCVGYTVHFATFPYIEGAEVCGVHCSFRHTLISFCTEVLPLWQALFINNTIYQH